MKLLLMFLLLFSFNASAADDTNCELALVMYDEGKFFHASMAFLTDAQDNRNACSAYNLGIMLDNGDGIDQNVSVARYWFNQAKKFDQ